MNSSQIMFFDVQLDTGEALRGKKHKNTRTLFVWGRGLHWSGSASS